MFGKVRVATAALLLFAPANYSAEVAPSHHFIAEVGCVSCHTTLPQKSALRERTPDLSSAGLRYNPAWLFEFLQNPVKTRRHLGRARMPNFHLNEREALALVEFLGTQKQTTGNWPELPASIQQLPATAPRSASAAEFESVLARGHICLNCHTMGGRGGAIGVELSNVGFRLQHDWVRQYLVAPAMYGVPHTTMPAQFYNLTNQQFEPMVPDPADRIGIIAGHLFSLNLEKRKALEDRFNRARQSATNITADLGRALFVGLNCAACHRNALTSPQLTDAAPDLTQEASRVKRTWLERDLRKPVAIRPSGFQPGSGSRMPDFRLSDEEIGEVVAVLAFEPPKRDGQQRVISAFAQHKARTLLTDKLSCLGCHRFGEKGGRIGPDLTTARERLQPDYVLQMIQNPRGANPHTIMPRVPMTPQLLHLITDFLLRHDQSPSASSYLSFVDHPLGLDIADAKGARQSYLRQCAPCHGSNGDGNGFNARYLPRKPTVHADSDYMSRRPDDTLFDGIHSGAGILSKSPYMPPWGETLSREEITAMVHHLRELCRCEGPAWSRDGKR